MTFLGRFVGCVRPFTRDRRGNVMMMFGFAVIPLSTALGVGIDYSVASRSQTRLNAIADAAALAAVSQSAMLSKTNAQAATIARNVFNAQAATIPGLVYNPADLQVTVTQSGATVFDRLAEVQYVAQSKNNFAAILGMSTLPLRGLSRANSAVAPNIDFHVLLDTSPSMQLPATTAGLATQTAKTGGCAFACHQTELDPSKAGDLIEINSTTYPNMNTVEYFTQVNKDSKGNVISTKYFTSYYGIAKLNNLVLRIDNAREAVAELPDFATDTSIKNGASYRIAVHSFDTYFTPRVALTADMNLAKSQSSTIPMLRTYKNSWLTSTINDNDTNTAISNAMAGMNTAIANPGTGKKTGGDTPQKILFIISDGMRDENWGGRVMGPFPASLCDTIKNRGIRIAVLYTEYLKESASDSWSVSNVRTPFLDPTDRITPAMQACATPGLFYKVTTDSDITAALKALFQKAVQTARIIK